MFFCLILLQNGEGYHALEFTKYFFGGGVIMMEGLGENVESPTPQKHGDTGSKKDGMQ